MRDDDKRTRLSKFSRPRVTRAETKPTEEGVYYWIAGKMLYDGETEFDFGVQVFREEPADPADG